MTDCPCTSGLSFDECCGPYLNGQKNVPTAEALLRSRYTAFTKTNIDYIRNTRHPRSESAFDEESARKWSEESQWQGLEIISIDEPKENATLSKIEFIARYKQNDKEEEHNENAVFVKDTDGRWYFQDGDFLRPETFVRKNNKVGRNDPCPCNSGKKFKKCCGR